jgi:hypothetical protein
MDAEQKVMNEEEEKADAASTRARASQIVGYRCARLQVYGVDHGVWVVVTDAGADAYEGGLSRQTLTTHSYGLPRVTGQFGNPTAVTLSASLCRFRYCVDCAYDSM